jgi:WhiB family redox-sensing transcriptional regulator
MGHRDWRDLAACLDEDTDLFFPDGSSQQAYEQMEVARQICARCEARDRCLAWALDIGQVSGVWGGLTEDERSAIRRRTRAEQSLTARPNRTL